MNPTSPNPVDAHLDSVTINMLCWKPSVTRSVAVAIVQAILKSPLGLYPDSVPDIPEEARSPVNANCIGIAFRLLKNQGIIARTTHFRRSNDKSAHGRTIFAYELASYKRAETFIARNDGRVIPGQQFEFEVRPT